MLGSQFDAVSHLAETWMIVATRREEGNYSIFCNLICAVISVYVDVNFIFKLVPLPKL